tara:strand:+ start:327 stop:569 length:243 start_codon:yes stop_codon:yes gene_type:complete
MKAAWFKDCKTKKEKEAVAQTLQSQREGLDRLKEILEPMLKDTTPASDYDSPSWAYKQADRNGFNRAVTTVLDLINLDKD